MKSSTFVVLRVLPRFTSRTLLLVMLVFSGVLASEMRRLRMQQDAGTLVEAVGGSAGYENRLHLRFLSFGSTTSKWWYFCKNMTDVYLGHSQVCDRDMLTIGRVPTLEYLDLNSTKIGDKGLNSIASNRRLRSLNLSGTRITDNGLAAIVRFGNLRVLDLSGTKISDAGIQAHLRSNPTLTELSLDDTAISIKSAQSLALLHTLNNLSLRNTDFDDSAIPFLEQLHLLTYLDLQGTRVTLQGKATLESALPQCLIWSGPPDNPSWR